MTSTAEFPTEHPTPDESAETIVFLHGGNVANWMWQPQVLGFPDFHLLTPSFPGFGARSGEDWVSLDATADDVAELVRRAARGGRAHVVGLSLGGVVAARVAARHPELPLSVLTTGAPLAGVTGLTRAVGGLQVRFWDKPWFWRAQARAFGLPEDSTEPYIEGGLLIRSATAARMMSDVYDGGYPAGLAEYRGRYLALAGERESSIVKRSFAGLLDRMPQLTTRIVPRMHHIWSIEDVPLFNHVVREWVSAGRPAEELLEVR